ncbi:MAG: hypothetical protein ACR2FP_03355 [Nocardioidaceae bacterium]
MAAAPDERVSSGPRPQPETPGPDETLPDHDTPTQADVEPQADGERPAPGRAAVSRRRSLDEVFGDVLPDWTRDERGDRSDPGRDADYLRDVPPHHN